MDSLQKRNARLVQAILQRAEAKCPGALDLIGVYGSFLTGDIHERSDLDLLILINDPRGKSLAATFIQEDLEVGHDLYCTTWEALIEDANFPHPHISKLMEANILYCRKTEHQERLMSLRKRTTDILEVPMSPKDYAKAENFFKEATFAALQASLSATLSEGRSWAALALMEMEDSIAMLNKRYFRLGTRRIYQELSSMPLRPTNLIEELEAVVQANDLASLLSALMQLLRDIGSTFHTAKAALSSHREPLSYSAIAGTYEEMYSNWRNKMFNAAKQEDAHTAFHSLGCLSSMLSEIRCSVPIPDYDFFAHYDPKDLQKTAEETDRLLRLYKENYHLTGNSPNTFPSAEDFIAYYLQKE